VLAYLFIQHIQSQSDNKWMDLQRSRRELTLAKNISQAIWKTAWSQDRQTTIRKLATDAPNTIAVLLAQRLVTP
jgi:hypothetical protein